MNRFVSTKVIPLGSCAFRQPHAESHCRLLHGYRLSAKFWFTCDYLDANNWVVDFGSLKQLKKCLEDRFDHKTAVWRRDPEIKTFEDLEKKGIVELTVFEDGVGIERFAEYCFNVANNFIQNDTNGRCWCEKVEVWEHEGNSAICENKSIISNNEARQQLLDAASGWKS